MTQPVAPLPNIRHLRAFATVVELRSINAAATHINLSQPALSQALRGLEEHFEARLLQRRTSGSFVTAEGDILHQRILRFFDQLDTALAGYLGNIGRHTLLTTRNRLTSSQIRAIIAIAQAGSFSLAAQMLRIAESSLHRVAHDCENTLHSTLFQPTALGLGTNRSATEMARRWSVAVREIEHAAEDIRFNQGRALGRIAVACLPLSRTLILPRAVNALLRKYPDIRVDVLDGRYDVLLQHLRRGTVDMLIGALRMPAPVDDIVQTELLNDPYAVVARTGHPVFREPRITADTLARYDWIIPRPGTPVRQAFEALFSTVAQKPRASIQTGSLVTSRGLLLESDRLTLLSHRQITVEEHTGLLRTVPFQLPRAGRPIGMATRDNWLPGPMQRDFQNCLIAAVDNAFYGIEKDRKLPR